MTIHNEIVQQGACFPKSSNRVKEQREVELTRWDGKGKARQTINDQGCLPRPPVLGMLPEGVFLDEIDDFVESPLIFFLSEDISSRHSLTRTPVTGIKLSLPYNM